MKTKNLIEKKYQIKVSLGLNFMIQFKAKTPNNIFIILTFTFTPYVTSPNILGASLNFYKNPNILNIFLLLSSH